MNDPRFTGERLHEGHALFAVDFARHRAAYEFASSRCAGARVLDVGCGSGAGTASLARSAARVVGIDRVAPERTSRAAGAHFCRADIAALPVRDASFDVALSFQVIEHLADPTPLLRQIAALLAPDGSALVSTPNRELSDGVNPYHEHEYLRHELRDVLLRHFREVEVLGVGASEPVQRYLAARSHRIRRVLRIDPFRLRERLPRALVERLFALGALLVRRQTAAADGVPDASWRDFPIGPADDATSLDWLAVCRHPRTTRTDG